MKPCRSVSLLVLILAWSGSADAAQQARLDLAQISQAATNASSLFLDAAARERAVGAFLKLVQIKGVSGQERAIREEVKRLLTQSGASEVPLKDADSDVPLNLVMELTATGVFTNKPGIILNAHLDTVAWSTPEQIAFDPGSQDFFHQREADSGQKSSSFGGDDRSGVAVIVEAVRLLQAKYWGRGLAQRRIVLVFTADEERGCVGAKHLSRHQPDLFANTDVTLSMDGPLDLRSNYPREVFVAVVSDQDSTILPHERVLDLMQDYCQRAKVRFGRTEVGLGLGDFAHFPATARAGLHLRSPVRGWHNRERVKVQDLINHVDLVCFLLLGWDHSLPPSISPETFLPSGR